MADGVAPGWYDDGTGTSTLRWWDGTVWTDNTVVVPPPASPSAPSEPKVDVSVAAGTSVDQPVRPLEIANRGERLRLDVETLTITFEGFAEQAVKKAASPRVLPLASIESVVYEPATTWKIGSLRVVIVGDSSPVRSAQFDINTVSIPAGRGKEASELWDSFASALAQAVEAAQPKVAPVSRAGLVPTSGALAGLPLPVGQQPDPEAPVPSPQEDLAGNVVTDQPDASQSAAASIVIQKRTAEQPASGGRSAALQAAALADAAKSEKRRVALQRQTEKQIAVAARKHGKQVAAANKGFTERHTAWVSDRELVDRFLSDAHSFRGYASSSLMLKSGEREYAVVNANLIEERAGRANYVGGHQGISIPIGSIGGHSVRYNVGSSRGHVERAAPVDTVIDSGKIVVTNQRIVFIGAKQTREHLFSKLVSIDHGEAGEVTISVSNRQKATRLRYPAQVTPEFQSRVTLAFALFQGTIDQYTSELQRTRQQVLAAEPKLQQ